jgi:hypothetical protein
MIELLFLTSHNSKVRVYDSSNSNNVEDCDSIKSLKVSEYLHLKA